MLDIEFVFTGNVESIWLLRAVLHQPGIWAPAVEEQIPYLHVLRQGCRDNWLEMSLRFYRAATTPIGCSGPKELVSWLCAKVDVARVFRYQAFTAAGADVLFALRHSKYAAVQAQRPPMWSKYTIVMQSVRTSSVVTRPATDEPVIPQCT